VGVFLIDERLEEPEGFHVLKDFIAGFHHSKRDRRGLISEWITRQKISIINTAFLVEARSNNARRKTGFPGADSPELKTRFVVDGINSNKCNGITRKIGHPT
jgi:hypothetical protein